jgi:hypothetical protein
LVLETVLDALESANGQVEIFYRFALETAWQKMSDQAKKFLRYMAQADASVSLNELQGVFKTTDMEIRETRNQLRRWSMILPPTPEQRYDLHPWVRRSVRSNLLEKWDTSSTKGELDSIAKWKYGV